MLECKIELAQKLNRECGSNLGNDIALSRLYAWQSHKSHYRFRQEEWGIPPAEWISVMSSLTRKQKTEVGKIIGRLSRAGYSVGDLRNSSIECLSDLISRNQAEFILTLFAAFVHEDL